MELPPYREIKTRFPLLAPQRRFIEESRQTVRAILRGEDPRLLLILGPCSIHEAQSAREFAQCLRRITPAIAARFFPIMRVYCEKPRTSSGWRGYLYDPRLDGSCAVDVGIEWTRALLIELAAEGVPAASEFLDPLTAYYYDDLITWGSIGARTASSQPHRQLAASLAMPIGFKNGIAGNVAAAVHGAMAAALPQAHIRLSDEGKLSVARAPGNPDVHIVLRGGDAGSNYDDASLSTASNLLLEAGLPERLLIDCSHGNSGKAHHRQGEVFQSIIQQVLKGKSHIRGIMMESHLYGGNQKLAPPLADLKYGISVTDACLDWSATQRLVLWGAECLEN